MAFISIHEIFRFGKKLKRWWDQRTPSGSQNDHNDTATSEPSSHQDSTVHQEPHPNLWGQQQTSSSPIHQSQNQINSSNPHFVKLRNQAISEGTLMKQKFEQAHRAYELKEGARAKELSNEGKRHQELRNQLNKQAAEWIFKENNRDSPIDTIDLHGLYVQESITYAEEYIKRIERTHGPDILKIIVGKGLHSQNFEAKLKPAIEKLILDHHLSIQLENSNSGVLVVQRNAPSHKIGLDPRVLNPDRCLIV